MNVLIACEFSGVVRDAFRRQGHEAWSCDLKGVEPEGDWPNYHLFGDVRQFIDPTSYAWDWDMLIAFPPCQHLAVSGARWFKGKQREQREALQFVRELLAAPVERIAVENPIGVISSRIRKPDQIIQPWQFGHGETKATCFWLKGLPKLTPTRVVAGRVPRVHHMAPSATRAKDRARTYKGVAEAMAVQWGGA